MNKYKKINDWLAIKITNAVGTMECAYVFSALAIWGGFGVDWHNILQIVQWVSQTFLQLTLLSVLMIGSQLIGASAEKRAQEDHYTILKQFEEIKLVHEINRKSIEEIKDLHKDLHLLINVVKNYVEIIHQDQPKSKRKN